jgi:hypothetical protein
MGYSPLDCPRPQHPIPGNVAPVSCTRSRVAKFWGEWGMPERSALGAAVVSWRSTYGCSMVTAISGTVRDAGHEAVINI